MQSTLIHHLDYLQHQSVEEVADVKLCDPFDIKH
jgi:hypothetical protein